MTSLLGKLAHASGLTTTSSTSSEPADLPYTINAETIPGPNEVLVQIDCCSVCHTVRIFLKIILIRGGPTLVGWRPNLNQFLFLLFYTSFSTPSPPPPNPSTRTST